MGDENIALSDRATRPVAPAFLRRTSDIRALLFMAHGSLFGPVSSRILKDPSDCSLTIPFEVSNSYKKYKNENLDYFKITNLLLIKMLLVTLQPEKYIFASTEK